MPPRHGKSLLCSQYFPAWYLANNPSRKVILASYGASLAQLNSRQAREIVRHAGAELTGVRLNPAAFARADWEVHAPGGSRGFSPGGVIAAGVRGAITGKGGDLIVVDDPVKGRDEAESPTMRDATWGWWQGDLYPRLEPGGALLLLQTRWHEDDLAGRVLRQARETGDRSWVVLNLPALAGEQDPMGREPGAALWPERWPREHLVHMRDQVQGPYDFAALYQQQPMPRGGTEWDSSLFEGRWFGSWPALTDRIVSLDPSLGREANAGDYSAIVQLGLGVDGKIYVAADLERRPTGAMVSDLVQTAVAWQADEVVVESNLYQELLGDLIEDEAEAVARPLPVTLIANTANKELRIRRLGPWFRQDAIRFRRDRGTRDLIDQLRWFPGGAHDDGPDALELALRALNQRYGMTHDPEPHEALRVSYR